MTEETLIFDPELRTYADEQGWRMERDSESGGMLGELPVFTLWALRGDVVLMGSWFGMRSQADVERMLLPAMRDADEDSDTRAACVHEWQFEERYGDFLITTCARECGAARRELAPV